MKQLLLILWSGLFAINASLADLEVYKDYDIGESVIHVSTVKVDANMMDVYLEGLRETWVYGNKIAKELGHIKNYKIFQSELPTSGEFNLMLVVYFDKSSDLDPSKKRYDEFMKKWGEKREAETKKIVKTYPDIRTLTGEYRVREIIMK